MSEQKQNQEVKEKKVVKLCPFISGFMLEPTRISMKENGVIKTTNVAPCIQNKCTFFNETEQECKIVQGLDDLHELVVEEDIDNTDEEKIGATDNE